MFKFHTKYDAPHPTPPSELLRIRRKKQKVNILITVITFCRNQRGILSTWKTKDKLVIPDQTLLHNTE